MASFHRRPNPETSTVVAAGAGAVVVGILGYFGYKHFFAKPDAAAAPTKQTLPDGTTYMTALPAPDPKSTDTDSSYLVAVSTSAPVTADQMPKKNTDGGLPPATSYLATIPVTGLKVFGPLSQKKGDHVPKIDPPPDLVLAVGLNGLIEEAMSKQDFEELLKFLDTGTTPAGGDATGGGTAS